jgi:hypothetical protein
VFFILKIKIIFDRQKKSALILRLKQVKCGLGLAGEVGTSISPKDLNFGKCSGFTICPKVGAEKSVELGRLRTPL